MTLRGTVEAVARSLGVYGFNVCRVSIVVDETGVSIQPAGGACSSVEDLTAALLLLGHARGLRVDIGECPACVARSGKRDGRLVLARWEWAQRIAGLAWSIPLDVSWTVAATIHHRMYVTMASRPCPACTVDGKPTGRHTIPWAQALLDGSSLDITSGLAFDAYREITRLSAIRTTLAVLADKMQDAGDPLGLWLAAWLGGACPGCPACNGAGLAIRCHGHGTLLGEHEPDLLAAIEPLTWIDDRLPRVGDRITVRHAFGDGEHFTGVVSEVDRGQVDVSGWRSSLADGWRYA